MSKPLRSVEFCAPCKIGDLEPILNCLVEYFVTLIYFQNVPIAPVTKQSGLLMFSTSNGQLSQAFNKTGRINASQLLSHAVGQIFSSP